MKQAHESSNAAAQPNGKVGMFGLTRREGTRSARALSMGANHRGNALSWAASAVAGGGCRREAL